MAYQHFAARSGAISFPMPTTATPATDPVLESRVFWFRYRRELIGAIVLLLVLGVGYAGYLVYQQRRDASADETLAAAKTADDFQKVISQYPSSHAAAAAYLMLADQQRNEGKFAEANETLQKFIAQFPKHELVSTARMAMAANLESLGKADEALSAYQRLVAADPHNFNAPLALISQVHLLKAKGQNDEARHVCERVMSEYSNSFVVGEATRQLRALPTPKPSATPAPAASIAPAASSTAPPSAAAPPTTAPPAKP